MSRKALEDTSLNSFSSSLSQKDQLSRNSDILNAAFKTFID